MPGIKLRFVDGLQIERISLIPDILNLNDDSRDV